MTNTNLTGIQLAAALAEEIYRRADGDIPINLDTDLDVRASPVTPTGSIAGFASDIGLGGATYYYTTRGFVGEIVEKGDTVYVVFRGSDSASTFKDGLIKAARSS